MKNVILYTDGACSGNPGDGGWGAVLMYNGVQKQICGFCKNTTNNQMELTAVIEGLKRLKEICLVDVFTDSAYVCNAFEQKWVQTWLKNGFINSKGESVANVELWKELIDLCNKQHVTFHKVKGHSDDELNNLCDKLATDQIKMHQKNV